MNTVFALFRVKSVIIKALRCLASPPSKTVEKLNMSENRKPEQGVKLRGAEKVARIPVKVIPTVETPRKPDWIRVKMAAPEEVQRIKSTLREQKLHTVCEEAACPNLPECFGGGTATFMIMGEICTRACRFCNIKTGKPSPLQEDEPERVAKAVQALSLRHVVITSVDRDDLSDGGAHHFYKTITSIKELTPDVSVEILTPDFLRKPQALDILLKANFDVFNHNLETVPRLYASVRPGARYFNSLKLLSDVKARSPNLFTKSGIMIGLGESDEEVYQVMDDLRSANVDFMVMGQYLQPTPDHHPVMRYAEKSVFEIFDFTGAKKMSFVLEVSSNSTSINLSQYDKGLYYYIVRDKNGNKIKFDKFIIQK